MENQSYQLKENQGTIFTHTAYPGNPDGYGRETWYFKGLVKVMGKEFTIHAYQKKTGTPKPYLLLTLREVGDAEYVPE